MGTREQLADLQKNVISEVGLTCPENLFNWALQQMPKVVGDQCSPETFAENLIYAISQTDFGELVMDRVVRFSKAEYGLDPDGGAKTLQQKAQSCLGTFLRVCEEKDI